MSLLDWDEIRSHYRVKDREFPMLAPDTPTFTFMGLPHARNAADLAGADYVIVYLLAGMALARQPARGGA